MSLTERTIRSKANIAAVKARVAEDRNFSLLKRFQQLDRSQTLIW